MPLGDHHHRQVMLLESSGSDGVEDHDDYLGGRAEREGLDTLA